VQAPPQLAPPQSAPPQSAPPQLAPSQLAPPPPQLAPPQLASHQLATPQLAPHLIAPPSSVEQSTATITIPDMSVAEEASIYAQVEKIITENFSSKLGGKSEQEKKDFIEQENKSSLQFLCKKANQIPKVVPKKSPYSKRSLFETCKHFISDERKFSSSRQRTLSWCVPNPKSWFGLCKITMCFNVDEVMAYIRSFKGTDTTKIPMFRRQQIQELFQSTFPDEIVTVDEYMSEEFMLVIENFDFLKETLGIQALEKIGKGVAYADAKLSNKGTEADALIRVVRKQVIEAFQKKIDATNGTWTGTFWKFAKMSAQALSRVYDLLQSPVIAILIMFVLKATRIALCILTVIDDQQETFWKMVGNFIGQLKTTSAGLWYYLYKFVEANVNCFAAITKNGLQVLLGNATKLGPIIVKCLADNFSTALSSAFGFLANMATNIFQGVMYMIGGQTLVDFARVACRQPVEFLKTYLGDVQAGAEVDIANVIGSYELVDFARIGIFVFIYYCPAKYLLTIIELMVGAATQGVGGIVLRLLRNYGSLSILTLLRYCFVQGGKLMFLFKVFEEILEWAYDMIGCAISYFAKALKDYVLDYFSDPYDVFVRNSTHFKGLQNHANGLPSSSTTGLSGVCCTAKIITDLVKAVSQQGEYAQTAREWDDWYKKNDNEALQRIGTNIVDGSAYAYNTISTAASDFSSAAYDWIFPGANCDEREKTKISETPFYSLRASDGNTIHFYLFTWKPTAIFGDDTTLHISPMAQEIGSMYPKAILEFKTTLFIMLDRLPKDVSDVIIALKNPVIDLNTLLKQ
jgi:hypothetical protein